MVSYTVEYIQHLKESYDKRSYLGEPKYQCKYCGAILPMNVTKLRAGIANMLYTQTVVKMGK